MASWKYKGACVGFDYTIWFRTKTVAVAKRVCRICPVQAECLAHAIENEEEGVWGGTTAQERKEMTCLVSTTTELAFEPTTTITPTTVLPEETPTTTIEITPTTTETLTITSGRASST